MSGLSSQRRGELERDLGAKLTAADHDDARGFLHFCDEWDGLLIDREDPEFDCCSCTFSDEFDPETGKPTASAMSASGQDAEERLEAQPASAVGNAETPQSPPLSQGDE